MIGFALGGCTDRVQSDTGADEGSESGSESESDSGSASASASASGPGSSSESASASGSSSSSGSPDACDGAPPTCTDQSVDGDCSDAIDEQPADCVGDAYECPPGYHRLDEIHCEWPTYCDGDAPRCWQDGDCGGESELATCNFDVWVCQGGFSQDCDYPCDGGRPAPDECWDQGPGECSDATQPPSCTDGAWQCPPGWDFGGFGEGCEWP
jgi:hypothetical protein